MVKIIPGIFVSDDEQLLSLLGVAKAFCDEIHIDIADGDFVQSRSAGIEPVWKIVPEKYEYNLHLMCYLTPEGLISWSQTTAKRVFIYAKAMRDMEFEEAVKIIRANGKIPGLVIDPNESVEELEECIGLVDEVMIMGVQSGKSGQEFIGGVLPKLGQVRTLRPEVRIGVDGGVNLETVTRLKGFDFAVSSSAIFGGEAEKGFNDLTAKAKEV